MTKPQIFTDLSVDALLEEAVRRGEGKIAANGALCVETGKRTGRSPLDRFIVCDDTTRDTVDWGKVNQQFDPEQFEKLWNKAKTYLESRDHFIAHLHVGADAEYALPVTVMNEYAWHNLFAKQLFIREAPPEGFQQKPWQILSTPGLHIDPATDGSNSDAIGVLDFTGRRVLLCGLRYAGEMKKAMFSSLNFWLPSLDVLPMHCAANVGSDGNVALFFGLSGTGKTTLSADPERYLIGDDEHGWSEQGVFNFEGGCYAKCIDLSKEREPVIWDAIRHGTVMENVAIDSETGVPDYTDDRFTQNTRAAYPLEYIDKRVFDNQGGQPNAVVFLTCDLYGVLPPVARLTPDQAAYYFLSGYTALVGSTEVGQTEKIKSTFSTCFGAPFFSRPPRVYAELLQKRIAASGCDVYLVNTGWSSGAYGKGGERFAIPVTRAVIRAVVTGQLKNATYQTLPYFNLAIPTELPGVDATLLDPRLERKDNLDYRSAAEPLIALFQENFKRFDVAPAIVAAGPALAE